ncbi:MAG: long-chain fatty acid--CoA ligase [candidate division KSB1 bacterium]|nr:long-chain fatty acid--CoA ligase [candidate division KSB1 bacterium]MDZ7272989.1 long-chain fatty acid--CoA ligase [candidate division KSB1 bacterium]MDZ7285093.1 long-chain fatty acid--CoA ligase [candidate division KSB1 bacterium]MDZ7298125.1 long-chain fatty acid--CoA ligase [candidate division KSB1 bacterium]MDZ7309258.1 long-chain fatty acid--CoA ligase [candidate division KSB1 bacterium]
MLHHLSVQNGSKPAYRFKRDGRWQEVSWQENEARCRQIARSLMALGVKAGDKVNILSQTRLEWVQCDFGIVSCGGVTVGIYPSNLAPDCAYIIDHSDAEVIFVENADQLAKILSVRAELPRLRHLIVFDGPGDAAQQVWSWEEFLARGEAVSETELEQRAAAIRPDDLASLVYTSGTTGVPKGAMLTHHNLIFTSDSASRCLPLEGEMVTLLFLPLAHVFARLIVYFCLQSGKTIAFAESIEKVAENLQEVKPHFIASVPRIYEKIYTRVLANVQAAGGLKAKLFYWALGVGTRVSQLQQQRQPIPAGLAWRHRLANKLVLHKVQAAFGGRLQWAVSGAAPLNKSIAEFFHACGITILEGIGMTENTSFTNVNRIDNNKFGTVGPVGPGIEMKLAEDGEVLYRGPNVMKGYYKNPAATAEAIDAEGWLHTGDIGEIDADGFLKITDRKKDLIITAGGKNVAPQRIERILRTSRYINQAVAVGDRQRFITALVTLNPEYVEPWARSQGIAFKSIDELVDHPKVRALIEAEVQEKNKQLASFESVKRVRIVPRDFTIAGGELTPTLKIRRKVVTEKYQKLLEEMYAE